VTVTEPRVSIVMPFLNAERFIEEASGASSARHIETGSQKDVQVEACASSFLYGISAGELSGEELAYSEPGYEVIIAVRGWKAVEWQ
jgi:hypothetical protein